MYEVISAAGVKTFFLRCGRMVLLFNMAVADYTVKQGKDTEVDAIDHPQLPHSQMNLPILQVTKRIMEE